MALPHRAPRFAHLIPESQLRGHADCYRGSFIPDGTPEKPKAWFCCCFKHDVVYWRGGTRAEREKADQELEQCVAAVGYPNIGATMRLGVYAGGAPYWPTWFRWGFGWPYFRDYGQINAEETAETNRLWRQFLQEPPQHGCL